MLKKIFKKIIIRVLTFEAKLILKKYQPKIIAITGSVGKTSTKDAVAAVLRGKFSVRESQKSYNSEIGVPLTIIGRESGWHKPSKWLAAIFEGMVLLAKKKKYPDILVLEMGADRPGDIERFAGWIKPNAVAVTALGEIPVHVEFFSGLEAVAKEKSKIIRHLNNQDWAIFNNDDKSVSEMKDKTKAGVLTFGMGQGADILGSNYHVIYRKDEKTGLEIPEGITFKADFKGSSVPVRLINTFGRHHVYAALAALAVGISQNLNLVEISEALSLYSAPPGRLKLIEGIKNSWILDDTYNASPIAMHAALDVLAEIPVGKTGRKIAVLGDMLELGRYAIEAHRQVGRKVSGIADLVFLV
ncbi:MAG: UDP-N-acetylmuramoyl-tripeptide--D-alanyl-D-alanine ligase, partial [Patescibacteria group bacterium]